MIIESALQLVIRTIPAASLVPFLTLPALDAWTPSDITADDLKNYAKRYADGSNRYGDTAQQRGVVVQIVNNFQGMAKHYVFVLFKSGGKVPRCNANYRGDFYRLKRLVAELWASDQHALSSKLLHRPQLRHSNPPEYGPSLAFLFLKVPEAASFERPDRVARSLALVAAGCIMSFGHESLLQIPQSTRRPRPSLSSSSSSSGTAMGTVSSSNNTMGSNSTAMDTASSSSNTTGSSSTAMDTTSSAATAAVKSFLASFRGLSGDEKASALIELKNNMRKDERHSLRRVLEVNAPDELAAEAVAKVSKEQWAKLVVAMKERAKGMKRDGVAGAAAFVTNDATLAAIDYDADLEMKRRVAPVPMAVIESIVKSTNHYYDLELQKRFLEKADLEGHFERDGRLFRAVGNEEKEIHFNYHGREHTLGWVRKEVADRGGALNARQCYISDMLVASWNHGQEVITPVILRLSAAATQWLSEHSFDLFSSLGALLPRKTSVAVVD